MRIWIGLFLIHRSLRFLGVGGSVDIYVRRVLCKLRAHLYRNSTFFFSYDLKILGPPWFGSILLQSAIWTALGPCVMCLQNSAVLHTNKQKSVADTGGKKNTSAVQGEKEQSARSLQSRTGGEARSTSGNCEPPRAFFSSFFFKETVSYHLPGCVFLG